MELGTLGPSERQVESSTPEDIYPNEDGDRTLTMNIDFYRVLTLERGLKARVLVGRHDLREEASWLPHAAKCEPVDQRPDPGSHTLWNMCRAN